MDERKKVLEDYSEVHRRSFEVGLSSAFTVTRPLIDLYTHVAVFKLSYRPESEGNPSTAFILNCAAILSDDAALHSLDMPPFVSPMFAEQIQVFRGMVADGEEEEKRDPMFVGWFVCICKCLLHPPDAS